MVRLRPERGRVRLVLGLLLTLFCSSRYICNLIYSVCGASFQQWCTQQVDAHRQAMVRDEYIEMDPEVHAAFQRSSAISGKCP